MAVLVVLCAILGAGGVAQAGRKRVVVLALEGPKAEKFHDELVKLIKKTHTVVPADKWNGTAEELDASELSEKNIKKVAKKLKIDAIIEGRVEKRRDDFILHLRLHEGRTGDVIGSTIDTKTDGPRIDGRAQRDLKDELVDAIDNVESNHLGGGSEDEDDKASGKKGAKKTDEDEDDKASGKKGAKKTDEDEDDKPVRKGFSRHSDDDRGGDKAGAKGAKKTDEDEDKLTSKKGAKKTDEDEDKLTSKKGAKKTDEDEDKLTSKKGAKKTDDEDKLPPKKGLAKTDDEDKLPPKKGLAKTDEDKLPPKKGLTKTDDEDKLPPKKGLAKTDEEDKLPPKKGLAKTDEDDDKMLAKKGAKKSGDKRDKKVASRDDDEGVEVDADPSGPVDAETALSPGGRALDAVVGLSVTARRMSFSYSPTLLAKPPGYAGTPVAGGMLDATIYPLAIGHKRADRLKDIGLNVMYDRVFKINSKDPMTGNVFATTEARFVIGGMFRYAFNKTAKSPVVIGSLSYSSQAFTITPGTGQKIDIPNVRYTSFEPGAGLRFPVIPKLVLGVDTKLMLITNTGQIQDLTQYGPATVLGFEAAAGLDYRITPNIFARAAFRFETIGFSFKGYGDQSNGRDNNKMTQDVGGARDSYIGGIATVGYLY